MEEQPGKTGEGWRYQFRSLHHICPKRLKTRQIPSTLHRPLACDLRFTLCPDVPSRKEAPVIVLIVLLFALSFKANYPLASFSPWSQVRLGKHSWHEDPWNSSGENAKTVTHAPPVISKAGPPFRNKVGVWVKSRIKKNNSFTDYYFLAQAKSFK